MSNRKQIKTDAKSNGLKSVFLYNEGHGGKLGVVSFEDDEMKNGFGDDLKFPHIEKITSKDGGEEFWFVRKMFKDVDSDVANVNIKSLSGEGFSVSNPAHSLKKSDYIGLKEVLEDKYFGKSFEDDTIRMQVIYNFLDIKKILALYISRIIFSVGCIIDSKKPEYNFSGSDIIGNMHSSTTFQKFENDVLNYKSYKKRGQSAKIKFYDLLVEEMSDNEKAGGSVFRKLSYFFPGVFEMRMFLKKDKKGNILQQADTDDDIKAKTRNNYDCFRVLSLVRQLVVHQDAKFDRDSNSNKLGYEYEDLFFNARRLFNEIKLTEIIDDRFSRGIDEMNDELSRNLKNNLYILSKYDPSRKTNELAEKYYRFIVYKKNRNIGIDARAVRENILKNHIKGLTDQKWDNCRKKIYMVVDFCIYEYFQEHKAVVDEIRGRLRFAKEEGDKDAIYLGVARKIYESGDIDFRAIESILETEAAETDDHKPFSGEVEYSIDGFKLKSKDNYGISNFSNFSKLMYFLALLLENKDKNILLDRLINKFDAIADLIDCIKYNDKLKNIEFAQKYSDFPISFRNISGELRLVKNISRMKCRVDDCGPDFFRDALLILGMSKERVGKEWVEIKKRIYDAVDGHKNLRNFIMKNVVKSKWFAYLSKSYVPYKCSMLMKNRSMLEFVIDKRPDEQIERYFDLVFGLNKKPNSMESSVPSLTITEKKEKLVKILLDFSFESIMVEVEKSADKDRREIHKRLVTLYLTVLYLMVKGIVDVNSRFVIAFSCYDRDSKLILKEDDSIGNLGLTEYFISHDDDILSKYYIERNKIRDDVSLSKEDKKLRYSEIDGKFGKTHYNTRFLKIIKDNMKETKDIPVVKGQNGKESGVCNVFRNIIAHYNVLANMDRYIGDQRFCSMSFKSFYSVFRYLLQRTVYDRCGGEVKLYIDSKYGDFASNEETQKKLMWILNIPFAYNLPRYKNLSIENLFNERDGNNDNG